MKKLLVIMMMLAGLGMQAQEKNAKASIEVDGVCNMCKSRIEKACIQTKGVKSATWSPQTHELKLVYDERKVSLDSIKSNIVAVGHDVGDLKAEDEVYDNISPCCKYRDEEVVKSHH